MNIKNLCWAIVLLGCTFLTQEGIAQITNLDYQIRYNTTSCRWDCFIVINGGSATSSVHRAQSNAQYSIVVPTGSAVTIAQNFNPIQNNQTYTGTTPMTWQKGSVVLAPAVEPQSDFHSIVPTLVPSAFFNNLVAGDTVRLFSLNISPMPNCASGIRVFRNGIDPSSSAPGMGGGDFSNGYTVGGTAQRYRATLPQRNPPPPALSAGSACSTGLEIDLTATSSACQTPLTYVWSGPNGFSGTSQDVFINPATPINNGTYTVTVTDSRGCQSTSSIAAVSKPNAGININTCPFATHVISGSSPNTGTWSALGSNPTGATLTPGSNGQATVTLGANAVGTYKFIYDIGTCKDTMDIVVNPANAGSNPPDVSCFLSGTSSLSASGTGTWSLGSGSAGTATISNPTSPSSTVSGFSAAGTYFFVWSSGVCKDTVVLQAGDQCGCAIGNNTLPGISPSSFCGSSGNVNISGSNASPTGGVYQWIYSLNNNTYSAAPGTSNQQNYTTTNLNTGAHRFRRIYTIPGSEGCSDSSNVILITVNNIPSTPANLTANPNPACMDQTVNLNVGNVSGASYSWTASSSNAGLVASTSFTASMIPVVSGNYSISVTASVNGCTSSPAVVSVQVGAKPPAPTASTVASTNPTVCNGTNGFISFSGLMASTGYSISYTRNGVSQSSSVTTNGSGVASINGLNAATYANFIIISGTGCPSDAYAGPVNLIDPNAPSAPANLVANPNPTCQNVPIALSVNNNAGATYNWSSASPGAGLGSGTSNTNTMLPTTSGTFNILVTQTVAGCTSPAASVIVTVNAAPPTPSNSTVISSNPTTCGGSDGSISFSGLTANGTFTLGYSRNGTSQTANITANGSGVAVLQNLSSGTYSNFQVTNASNCQSGVSTHTVTLTSPGAPSAPQNLTALPNTACLGVSVSLSVTNNPGALYNWAISNPNGGLGSSTSHTNSMNASAPGVYTVQVTQTVAGCTSPSSSVQVTIRAIPATPSASTVSKVDPTCDLSNGSISISGYEPNAAYSVSYVYNGSSTTFNGTSNSSGSVIITNLSGGQYSNFSLASAGGCNSGVYTGTVILTNPGGPPAPGGLTVSSSFICVGNNVQLSVSPSTGASYSWVASSSFAGLVPSSTSVANMIPTQPGLYSISVTQTISGCTSPPAVTTVEVRGDCYKPDINVSFINVQVDGDVSSNDGLSGVTYASVQSLPGNPSSCIPVLQTNGKYSFTCGVAGVYNFIVNSCTASCEGSSLVITIIDQNANNQPPVVNSDFARTRMNVPISIQVAANDGCQNSVSCSLSNPTIITPPMHGTYNAITKIYTPNSNFVGIDSFRYEVCQMPVVTPVNCRRSWVYVSVLSGQGPNLTNARDDYAQTPFNTPINRTASDGLLANDTDPEGDSQSVIPFTSNVPGIGNISVNADGSFTYTPAVGYFGTYNWVYQVCDNNTLQACDKAVLYIAAEPQVSLSSIGNFVWSDLNANGIQDSGEPGLSNVQVRLHNNSGVMVASTNTGANGQYQFNNVTPGTYYIKVTAPANYVYAPANVGDPLTDSDITGSLGPGTTNFFSILPGESRSDIDAGLYVCSRLSGFLWYDYHTNEIKDNFENGLNGIFVFLWRNVNGSFVKWGEAKTDLQAGTASEDGYFNFPCVPPGQYYLQVDLPLIGLVRVRPNVGTNPNIDSDITNANGHMTTNTFVLTPGQHKTDLSGGFYPMANAGNLVWIDINVNGLQDPGEPTVSGVVVEARDPQTNAVKGYAVTNENGEYNIDYLEKSDVYLKFTLPQVYSSYTSTFARVGNDVYNSDVDNSYGNWTTRAVEMSPNVTNANIDLGIVQGALPVTWVDVDVYKDNVGDHIVSWITAQEVNVSHYEVERSMNNPNSFETIVEKVLPLTGQGVNKFYTISDSDNQKIGVYYYRIKQVDLDGKFAYSNTVSIRNNENIDANLYPSPAIDKTSVSVRLPVDSEIRVDLFDINAKFISTMLENSHFEKGDHSIDFDISHLKSGVYNVNITINQQSISKKLIVLEK